MKNNFVYKIVVCMGALVGGVVTQAYANDSYSASVDTSTHFEVQRFALKDAAQKKLGLGDSANAFALVYKRNNVDNNTLLNIGLGFVSYEDKMVFSQNVQVNNGYSENRNSQVLSLLLEADYGIQRYFDVAQKNYWNLRAGYTALPLAKRTLEQLNEVCSGCKEEKFTIKGGAYAAVGIGHYFAKTELSLEYRQYAAGDLKNSLQLSVGYRF